MFKDWGPFISNKIHVGSFLRMRCKNARRSLINTLLSSMGKPLDIIDEACNTEALSPYEGSMNRKLSEASSMIS